MVRPKMKIFITGGNGFIGSRTVRELVGQGYSVRCLLRAESDIERLEGLPFEIHRGDIRDLASLKAGAAGCDAILHLAGPSSWAKIQAEGSGLSSLVLEGARNVLEAARENGNLRTVFVSSTVAIGGSIRPEVFNEDSPCSLPLGHFHYAAAKRSIEMLVRESVANDATDAVIVNPCETYGESDRDLITAGNLLPFLGNGPAFVCTGGTAVAHVDDVARGIVLALEKGRAGERYILGGENLTLEEIARTVRKIAGKKNLVFRLPNSVTALACRGLARAGLPSPVSADVFEYASRFWFVDSTKAQEELGYRARPADDVFRDVVPWLLTQEKTSSFSFRYGGGPLDARSALIRGAGALQKKDVVILDSDPELCGKVLAASSKKGNFLESLVATPAWHPIYSIESMDGERWEQLSADFKRLLHRLEWRERLGPITRAEITAKVNHIARDPAAILDSEAISRLVVRILYALLFDHSMSGEDETLFYRASLEWRKEIAVKGRADSRVKSEFWERLTVLVAASRFRDGLASYAADPARWLSLFAQPFLISPQINIGDIFAAIFHYLNADARKLSEAREWARQNDRARLDGITLEAIRLRHPFPILERELERELRVGGKYYAPGTQFFILLDRFRQDPVFNPERWLKSAAENPYAAIPFAAGPRMCIGKPIAMELMADLLRALLVDFPEGAVQPGRGHLLSGRGNDRAGTPKESRYQAGVFSRVLWRSYRIGRKS